MVNYQCFERLVMSGDSKESDIVKSYLIKLREFLIKNLQFKINNVSC